MLCEVNTTTIPMRMTILPRALWIAYNVITPSQLQVMLPDELRLAPVQLLENEPAEFKLLFNAYKVRSHWMTGSRVDIQTFARHRTDNTPHLVILDVATDTMDWDPIHGIRKGNAVTRNKKNGNLDIDVSYHIVQQSTGTRLKKAEHMSVRGNLADATKMTRDFAVRANRKCYFRNHSSGYNMSFDDECVMQPVRTLTAEVKNGMWSDARMGEPTHVFMHEQQMVFDVDVKLSELW